MLPHRLSREVHMQSQLPTYDVPKDSSSVSRGVFAVAAAARVSNRLDLADLPNPPKNDAFRPR